jgi:hypothetical protein
MKSSVLLKLSAEKRRKCLASQERLKEAAGKRVYYLGLGERDK